MDGGVTASRWYGALAPPQRICRPAAAEERNDGFHPEMVDSCRSLAASAASRRVHIAICGIISCLLVGRTGADGMQPCGSTMRDAARAAACDCVVEAAREAFGDSAQRTFRMLL